MCRIQAYSVYIFACAACFTLGLNAETIELGSGEVIEGRIVEQTEEFIRVLDGSGFLHKYQLLEVKSITAPQPQEPSPPEPLPFEPPVIKLDTPNEQLKDNLGQVSDMVQDALKQLYPQPSGMKYTPVVEEDKDQLKEERD